MKFFNWTNFLFHPCLQYVIYFTHCFKQNISFTFLKCIFSVYKVVSQTRLCIAKETSEAKLHKLKRHLFAERSEAIFYLFNIHILHVLQTIIYFMKKASKYLFQKYSSPPPLGIEWWPPNIVNRFPKRPLV